MAKNKGKKKDNPIIDQPVVTEAPEKAIPAGVVTEVAPDKDPVAKAPKPLKDVLQVKAVIRPMHSPEDNLLIPDEGSVLIKKSSWATSQLQRGLLKIVE